jgi:hypothetical protein
VETYFYWSHIADPNRATDWDTGGASLDRIEAGDVAEWEDQEEVALLRDLQDDYFRIALDEYSALQGGSWFDSGGWIQPGQEIAGSAAETVLSDFFRNR